VHAVIAHIGGFPAEETLFSPLVFAIPVLAVWLYLRGLVALPGVTGPGRRFAAFVSAVIVLIVAFSPPAEAAADAFFSVHMGQHLVVIVAVPVLLTYSHGLRYLMMGLPRRVRRIWHPIRRNARRWTRWLTFPAVAIIYAATLWAWHLPVLYDAAVGSNLVHLLEHASLFLAGLLLWGAVMDSRRGFLPRSMLIFGTAFHSGLLGALLVLASEVLYRSHLNQTLASISPLEDQQLAGLIMWIPMGGFFLVTLAILVIRVLDGSDAGLVGDAGH
jgi:putative membrane protein